MEISGSKTERNENSSTRNASPATAPSTTGVRARSTSLQSWFTAVPPVTAKVTPATLPLLAQEPALRESREGV
jgi:hypothetical protein